MKWIISVIFVFSLGLFNTAIAAIDVVVYQNQTQTISISGLQEPIQVSCNNNAVVNAWIQDMSLFIAGIASGTATVTVTGNGNKKITVNVTVKSATYRISYTVYPSSVGMITSNPEKSTYEFNERVTFTAVPVSECYEFYGWSGDCQSSDGNSCTLVMDSNKNVIANFIIQYFTLSIQSENGDVRLSPESTTYKCGREVILEAIADQGFEFSYWQGGISDSQNPVAVNMQSDMTIQAVFTPISYKVVVRSEPEDGGIVELSPEKSTYSLNEEVILTASALTGYHFDHWSGDISSEESSATLTVTKDLGITAVFMSDETSNPLPDIKVNGSDTYIAIEPDEFLTVSISLDSGAAEDVESDWWLAVLTPLDWYYLDAETEIISWKKGFAVSYQGPLVSFSSIDVLNIVRPTEGFYTFYFGVDLNQNGHVDDPLYYDFVEVNVFSSDTDQDIPFPVN
ncbi:MAG: hypothetical protein HQK77_17855 [Desulfobacterales bacterium]|nr:hypothetical protein [Desulfobacterales bacterium]